MIAIKCKYCGGSVALTGANHACCEYCGQELTLPNRQEERAAAMYERAGYFRARGEFDKAYSAYQHLAEENNTDPELHWCMVLCRYGVEYVEDERLSNKELGIREFKPTISRMSFESILEDPDYKAAIQYADETGRRIYRREAGEISRIQSRYLEIARNEQPYDVFISFKDEEPDGTRTKAGELGQEIYEQLTAKGLKVFFSRITLEDKLSDMYEPYIYAALRSAKVMLLIGDSKEQLESRWVKNEWSRFLAMAENDRSKTIIPVYNTGNGQHISPYDFPDGIPAMQAQDMGKIGAMQDLVRGVSKLTGHEKAEQKVVLEGGITAENLLRRAAHALKDGQFEEAQQLTNQVLDADAQNGYAYLYQLLAVNSAASLQELVKIRQQWDEDKYYRRAKQFGNDRLLAELALFEEECRKETILKEAERTLAVKNFAETKMLLDKISSYPGAAKLLERCVEEERLAKELEAYRAEVGNGADYLTRKFKETYPSEYKKWCALKKASAKADGGKIKISAIGAALMLVYAVYVVVAYKKNTFGMTNEEICVPWAVLGGITHYFSRKEKEQWADWKSVVGWAALLWLGANCLDMFYVESMIEIPLMPVGMLVFSVVYMWKNRKGFSAVFAGKARQKSHYYEDVVEPIGEKLRTECIEQWRPRVGAENLIALKKIE